MRRAPGFLTWTKTATGFPARSTMNPAASLPRTGIWTLNRSDGDFPLEPKDDDWFLNARRQQINETLYAN
jgi:hypothetical protein